MNPSFATSSDGAQIAYECCGNGPAIILLHGGGGCRQEWREAGYIERLQNDFTVVSLDLRGHGESSLSTDPTDYTVTKMVQDILAVADACRVEQFALCGMSHGGKTGQYLAIHSRRVDRFILMSAPLGPGTSPQLRLEIAEFTAHWSSVLQAQCDGTLDLSSLPREDQEFLQNFKVAAMLGWGPAMLKWPSVRPTDFTCPVLWLIGSEDHQVMESVREFESALEGSPFQVHIFPGLDHGQVFDEIERVFPVMRAFLR